MSRIGQAPKSSLVLHNILVNNVEFNRSEGYKDVDENELRFTFKSEIYESPDSSVYKVSTITTIDNGDNKELYISITLSGYFGFEQESDITDEVKDSFIKVNTLAILFPYVRSYITNITSQSGIKPIIIPPINITELVKQQDDDSLDKE